MVNAFKLPIESGKVPLLIPALLNTKLVILFPVQEIPYQASAPTEQGLFVYNPLRTLVSKFQFVNVEERAGRDLQFTESQRF